MCEECTSKKAGVIRASTARKRSAEAVETQRHDLEAALSERDRLRAENADLSTRLELKALEAERVIGLEEHVKKLLDGQRLMEQRLAEAAAPRGRPRMCLAEPIDPATRPIAYGVPLLEVVNVVSDSSGKLRAEVLRDKPEIVMQVPAGFARQHKLDLETVEEISKQRWAGSTTHVLDVSTGNELEPRARALFQVLVEDWEEQERTMALAVAAIEPKDLNRQAVVGLYRTGNVTYTHRHCLGVLNLLLSGKKTWQLWPPRATEIELKSDEGFIEIEQGAGDLLFIPPGWFHRVS